MRIVAVGMALLFCSLSCFAAEVGIGVSAKSDDAWIYLPISWSGKYRIEPSIRYAKDDISSTQLPSQFMSGSTTRQDVDALEIGVGAFRISKIAESVQLSFGVRLAYVDSKSSIDGTATSLFGSISQYHSESSQDGYRIAPAVGFEYLFGEHFSIGGEASYSFLDVDGDGTTTQGVVSSTTTTFNSSQRSSGTETQLILRYMF